MTPLSFHYAVALAAVPLTAVAHLLLKTGAARSLGGPRIALWVNRWTIAGYALMLSVTLMNLFAYRLVPVRANVVLSPLVFFTVTLLSIVLLRERLTKMQTIGCALIILGVAVFYV